MLIKLFSIPVGDNGAGITEMNTFLKNHKVLEIESHFTSKIQGDAWHFCVRYLEINASQGVDSKAKIDYREVLDEVTFKRFSKLREIRKQISAEAGATKITSLAFASSIWIGLSLPSTEKKSCTTAVCDRLCSERGVTK